MLAQLEEIPGCEVAWTDRPGAHIALELSASVDRSKIAEHAQAVIDQKSVRTVLLEGTAATEKVADLKSSSDWMRSGETVKLSEDEGRIVAARWAKRAQEVAKLTEDQEEKLRALLSDTLESAYRDYHASMAKGDPALVRHKTHVQERFDQAMRQAESFLDKEQHVLVKDRKSVV